MALKTTVKLKSRIFLSGELQQKLTEVVKRNALAVEAEAKLRIKQGSKTGRTYRRRSIKRSVGAKRAAEFQAIGLRRSRLKPGSFVIGYSLHRASAPGESPADDTGNLANRITATEAVADEHSVRASVISGAAYGRLLEEEMNRPYLRPALEQVKPQFTREVKAAVAELL